MSLYSREGSSEGLKRRDSKRLSKQNSKRECLQQYRQVNYMQMLSDIISNDFIDDKLTKFLHILEGGSLSPL